jgi:hypothetical protein
MLDALHEQFSFIRAQHAEAQVPSVHDHRICEMTIDVVRKQIRMRTAYQYSDDPDFADVCFEGVAAYVFEGEAFGTILDRIIEEDTLVLYRYYADQMQRENQRVGGHPPWATTDANAAEFLPNSGLRGFWVLSSIGLTGAVWCDGLTISPLRKS